MDTNRWQRIQALFNEAIDLSLEEQATFLDEACAEDPALRAEVENLLLADAKELPWLDASPHDLAALVQEDQPEDAEILPSQHIGPWRLVKQIGRGGMGVVYLAERADQAFDQQVALKVVKRGMDTDEILRRFRYERQILATLQHPHIAQLYDGGATSDGRPYLAMEYVEGKPIDEFCDTRRLTINARLLLFQTVCEAVQYAHQNLVVHRDLKPSNILVTDTATPKLLDFGIAKLLDEHIALSRPLTRTGLRVMTPEYAAPEQAQGASITTATDVYALGIILYELLTGRRPRPTDGLSQSTPLLPSTAITRTSERKQTHRSTVFTAPKDVSAARGTTPERLQRRLRGDLDVICLKALRPEPSRRYASAEALMDDIKRHLDGLPVSARPDTVGYRLTTFLRRHRATAMAALLVFLLLVGYAITVTAQSRRIALERDKAEEVSTFLADLFAAPDPFSATATDRLDTLRVRDFLERGAEKAQTQLGNQPLVQAQLLTVMGGVYRNLGLYDQARAVLEQALQTRTTGKAPLLDIAETQSHLAVIYKEQGLYTAADSLFQHTLTTRRDLLGPNHPDVATSLTEYGVLMRGLGHYDQAEQAFNESLAIYQKALGPDDQQLLGVLNDLAELANDKGDYVAAEKLLRELLTKRRTTLGDDHPLIAITLSELAAALRSQGRYDESEIPIREALAINRKVFGGIHPNISANLNVLAAVYRHRIEYDEAERLTREALSIDQKIYGEQHAGVAYSLTNLGEILREKGDYEGAIQAHREALRLVQRVASAQGIEDVGIGIITGFVARVLYDKGDYAAAEPLYREALALLQRLLPENHARTSGMASGLGATLKALGQYEEAELHLLEGYRGLQRTLGNKDERTERALNHVITLYTTWGKPAEAAAYHAKR